MEKEKEKNITFKEYVQISKWSLGISMKISKFLTISSFVTTSFRHLQKLINIFIVAKIVDLLISYVSDPTTSVRALIPYILIMAGIQLLSVLTIALDSYSARSSRRLTQAYVDRFLYEKISELGIQTVQLPDVANKMQKANEWIGNVMDVTNGYVRFVAALVTSIAAGIIMFNFSPLIASGIMVVSLIYFFKNKHFFKQSFRWQTDDENVEERRKAQKSGYILSSPIYIDEISLYGSKGYLDNKYRTFFDYYLGGLMRIFRRDILSGVGIDVLNLGVLIYGMIEIFKRALAGLISVGDTTFYISAINSFYESVTWFFSEIVFIRDIVSKEKEAYDFFQLSPAIKDGKTKLDRLITPPALELRDVSFKYPNSERYIFQNFNFKLESGEKIAIVGENGAGKTTLVKLLCRFYDPNEGDIFVNGINLKDLKLNDWYKNVGVLFQDFNFYDHLTVRENIYMGKTIKEIDEEKIIEASKNADAYEFIQKYENGFDTVMNERFKGGIRPSKGQQQKIAIARFFYRDAPLAIFDEPTASIDADAEYRIFNRIYNFFDNKTVIIISHRFSTVRNADRIIVIKEGAILEEGSHNELLAKKGLYYDNFKKQAEGYV